MSFRGSNFNDRIAEQKKAKLELLKRAKAKQIDPEVKAKLAEERISRNKIREERKLKAEEDRVAKALQDATDKAAKEKATTEKAAKDKAAQKARRDAKYAARKARR
ncbi:MAG: hypothetical protein COA69_06605 [Robiginitomaculum sp.]|nr:MAG: hypothetical protein COA69_06605 [Robiginitomaculum sp.]